MCLCTSTAGCHHPRRMPCIQSHELPALAAFRRSYGIPDTPGAVAAKCVVFFMDIHSCSSWPPIVCDNPCYSAFHCQYTGKSASLQWRGHFILSVPTGFGKYRWGFSNRLTSSHRVLPVRRERCGWPWRPPRTGSSRSGALWFRSATLRLPGTSAFPPAWPKYRR